MNFLPPVDDTFSKLLQLVSDPEATKKRLAEIKDAQKTFEVTLDEIRAKERELTEREGLLSEATKALEKDRVLFEDHKINLEKIYISKLDEVSKDRSLVASLKEEALSLNSEAKSLKQKAEQEAAYVLKDVMEKKSSVDSVVSQEEKKLTVIQEKLEQLRQKFS